MAPAKTVLGTPDEDPNTINISSTASGSVPPTMEISGAGTSHGTGTTVSVPGTRITNIGSPSPGPTKIGDIEQYTSGVGTTTNKLAMYDDGYLTPQQLEQILIGILRNIDGRKVTVDYIDLEAPLRHDEVLDVIELQDPPAVVFRIRKLPDSDY